jgi:hypothetical protein
VQSHVAIGRQGVHHGNGVPLTGDVLISAGQGGFPLIRGNSSWAVRGGGMFFFSLCKGVGFRAFPLPSGQNSRGLVASVILVLLLLGRTVIRPFTRRVYNLPLQFYMLIELCWFPYFNLISCSSSGLPAVSSNYSCILYTPYHL